MKKVILFLLWLTSFPVNGQTIIHQSAWAKYFDKPGLKGSFVLYDLKKDQYTVYNEAQLHESFLPASTFKICNSLIGLETGIIPDESFVIKWDGKKRGNENWDMDNDLASAFRYSVVWYYQELTRRVGAESMQYWVSKAHYGNENTGGGIDQFWLRGNLRITPAQQIDFMKRFYLNQLPFSQRNIDIVKKIMIVEKGNGYVLRAKTGWAASNSVGWYVGWLEKGEDVYFFSTCIQGGDDFNMQDFGKFRIDITRSILKELTLLP